MKGVTRFADRRIRLRKLLGFQILRTHFADWRILNAQRITDVFNISAWIMDFVCFEVRIAEINLVVGFNFFWTDFRTRLDYSRYQ